MTAPSSEVAERGFDTALLALVCSAQFVLQLDFSIVNVALPTMQRELHFAPAELQWVVTGYAMTFGSLLLIGGRAGDLFGRRKLLQIGLLVFVVASLTCGLAQSPVMLVVSRLVQGAGGALISPSALSLLTSRHPEGPIRNRALGIWQAAAAGGATAGVVFGGLLTQYIDWRAIFFINVPIVGLLSLLVPKFLEADQPAGRTRLDLLGGALITATLAALIFGLSNGQQHGFAAPTTWIALGAAAVGAVAFVSFERRTPAPMLPSRILASPTRRASDGTMVLIGAVVASYVYFGSLYLQRVLHFDPVTTGLCFIPSTVTVMVTSTFLARRLIGSLGVKQTLLAGLCSAAVGQFWLSHISSSGSYAVNVLAGLLFTAFGMGLVFPSLSVGATAGVDRGDQGLAGGLFNTSQQIGAAAGLSTLAIIAAFRTTATHGSLVAGYRLSYLIATGIVVLAGILVGVQIDGRQCQREVQLQTHRPDRSADTTRRAAPGVGGE